MGALEQTRKSEGMLPMFGLISSREYILNLIEELRRDQRLMVALVLDSPRRELS